MLTVVVKESWLSGREVDKLFALVRVFFSATAVCKSMKETEI